MCQFLVDLGIFVLTTASFHCAFAAYLFVETYKTERRRLRLHGEFDWNKVTRDTLDLTTPFPYPEIFGAWSAMYSSQTIAAKVIFAFASVVLIFRQFARDKKR
jgi:hypothetical protein